MKEVIELKVLEGYHIWLKFKDGDEQIINFRPYLGQGFTEELLEVKLFRNLGFGTLVLKVKSSGVSCG